MNILIRLPNWLGDIVMAWPVIKGIQNTYPQAQISLLGLPAFASLVEVLDKNLHFHPLPKKNLAYYWKVMRAHRGKYDIQVVFTNSERGDMEAWLINAPRRIGVQQGSKPRKMLNETYALESKINQSGFHQTKIWEQMAQASKLLETADTSAVTTEASNEVKHSIGLICGSENSPEKRWPPTHWKGLIQQIFEHNKADSIVLFGTQGDVEICEQISHGFDAQKVINRAGKTNLKEFAKELASCKVVIANDTGGMHLANALGVPVMALYGPTNPVATGAVFDGATIIQPQGCPPSGGVDIDLISPEQVLELL